MWIGASLSFDQKEEAVNKINSFKNRYLKQYNGSPSRTRTYDLAINSRVLYQLSYRGT